MVNTRRVFLAPLVSLDLSHFGIRIACEAEREPGEISHQLLVIGPDLFVERLHPPRYLALQMRDPLLGVICHARRSVMESLPLSVGGGGSSRLGRQMVNVVPSTSELSTLIAPLCALTIRSAM